MGAIGSCVVCSVDRKSQGVLTSVISESNQVVKNMQAPIDVI